MGYLLLIVIIIAIAVLLSVLSIAFNLLVNFALNPLGTLIALFRVLTFGVAAISGLLYWGTKNGDFLSLSIVTGVLWITSFLVSGIINGLRGEHREQYDNEPS